MSASPVGSVSADADPAALPRFVTPLRAVVLLLTVACFVGLGWLGAPMLGGKPSETTAATVARDVSPVMYLDQSSGDTSGKPEVSREVSPACAMSWYSDDRGVMWVFVPVNHSAVYLPDDDGVWLTVDKSRHTWVWITDGADGERVAGGEWITYDGDRPYCGTAMPIEPPR